MIVSRLAVILLFALFAVPAFASTPEHFFDSLTLHPQAPIPVPTIPPPPVLTPVDPTPVIAMIGQALGQNSAWTAWAQKGIIDLGTKVDAIVADEALEVGATLNLKNRLDALEAKAPIPGPPGPQGPPGTPAPLSKVISVDAASFTAGSVPPRAEAGTCISTSDVGWIAAGQTVDYTVTIPTAGNYLLTACTATPNVGASYHFEYPIGTNLGSTALPLTNGWYTFRTSSTGKAVAFPAGPAVIRVVFETTNQNFGGFTLTVQ